jgi:hypothetical protein
MGLMPARASPSRPLVSVAFGSLPTPRRFAVPCGPPLNAPLFRAGLCAPRSRTRCTAFKPRRKEYHMSKTDSRVNLNHSASFESCDKNAPSSLGPKHSREGAGPRGARARRLRAGPRAGCLAAEYRAGERGGQAGCANFAPLESCLPHGRSMPALEKNMRKSKHNAAPSNRLCEKQLPVALKKVLSAQSALQSPSQAHKNFLD